MDTEAIGGVPESGGVPDSQLAGMAPATPAANDADTEAHGGADPAGIAAEANPDAAAATDSAAGPDAETASMPAVVFEEDTSESAWSELRQTIRRLTKVAVRRDRLRDRQHPEVGLFADPRLPRWIGRAVICVVAGAIFGLLLGWRVGLTIAVVIAVGDTLLRARTATVIPAAIRVTRAQRQTTRRLTVLRAAGYHALHARTIPGTESVIDNLVVGPPGVFALDSELWDRRLPIRIASQMLYHGPASQKDRIGHATWEAQQAANLISMALGRPVRVRPAMVIYGPNVPWTFMRIAGVDVFGGGWIAQYFRHQLRVSAGRHLHPDQVAAVFAAATRALPPVPALHPGSHSAVPAR